MERNQIQGQCLCGAVTVSALRNAPDIRACHCDMCRRWTSSMFMTVPCGADTITVDGPVKVFRSSDWAERAFCDTCGSALWYMTVEDQHRNLAAGLCENAAGNRLSLEFYSDRKPDGYALAGDHKRLSEAQTIALFTSGEEEHAP